MIHIALHPSWHRFDRVSLIGQQYNEFAKQLSDIINECIEKCSDEPEGHHAFDNRVLHRIWCASF